MTDSSLRIVVEDPSVCAGDEFIAHVRVDSPDRAINAVQGALLYDAEHLMPVAVHYGDSFLRYWVTAPALPERAGEVPFIGGLPFPGFQGTGGNVMSVVFKADSAGVDSMLLLDRDAHILLNDGDGTPTRVSFKDQLLTLLEPDAVVCEAAPPKRVPADDTVPPLPFEILIERNNKIFDGNYFAAFETKDEGSGIAYYEIRESSSFVQTPWLKTSSPYELRTQGGEVRLIVRAVDGAGNARLASISRDLPVAQSAFGFGGALTIVAALVTVIVLWTRYCRGDEDK